MGTLAAEHPGRRRAIPFRSFGGREALVAERRAVARSVRLAEVGFEIVAQFAVGSHPIGIVAQGRAVQQFVAPPHRGRIEELSRPRLLG